MDGASEKFWYLFIWYLHVFFISFYCYFQQDLALHHSHRVTQLVSPSPSSLQLLCLLPRQFQSEILAFYFSLLSPTASPYILVITLEHCSDFRFLTPVQVLHFWCGIRALTCRKQFKLFPALPNPEPQFKHACASQTTCSVLSAWGH